MYNERLNLADLSLRQRFEAIAIQGAEGCSSSPTSRENRETLVLPTRFAAVPAAILGIEDHLFSDGSFTYLIHYSAGVGLTDS